MTVGVELAEQFSTQAQQRHAGELGMWAWLLTELLLFGGLFCAALVLHQTHPQAVHLAARHLKFWIGAANTMVLIASSFTMSGAIMWSRAGAARGMLRWMWATAGLGGVFLVLKSLEYWRDWQEHMTPFLHRPYALADVPPSRLFVDLYFLATGLHAVHLSTGVAILLGLSAQAAAPGYLARHQNRIELFGLYWHFIDLIWVLVFVTIYAVSR